MSNPFESPVVSTEYRSGVEWHVTYEKEAGLDEPLAGYVADKNGNSLIEIALDANSGGYDLDIKGMTHERFETFDEAMDFANEFVQSLPSQVFEKYPVHELTGQDGIYSLGEQDGKEYIINAFWSDAEPGYVNVSVFSLGEGDQLDIITSAFYNGFLSIGDCVRSLAEQFTPLEHPDIRLVADCSYEFDTPEELREALEEGRIDGGPVRLSDLHRGGEDRSKPLSDLKQEAKERADEKNQSRAPAGKNHGSPELEQ